ncbi:MAG: lytic transglycosylase domain-containing protein [Holosporales bacterium]|nr:lytic transglycosylase domain-containing protein [Holosporales bacterium]
MLLANLGVPSGRTAFAQSDAERAQKLHQAIAYVRKNALEKADTIVGEDAFLKDLVRWFALTRKIPFGTFSEIRHFIETHPHWPEQDLLRNTLEKSATIHSVFSQEDLHWLKAHPPHRGETVLAYVTQIKAKMPSADFKKCVRSLWMQATFSTEEENAFLFAYRGLLRPQDMLERVNALLWKRQATAAERLLPFIPDKQKPLTQAHIQLVKGDPKKTLCPPALLKQFRSVPSFAYAVIYLEHKKDVIQDALSLLKEVDFFKDTQHIRLWGNEVQYVARELIRQKRFQDAYQILARAAFPVKEDDYANAQLLAGWLALQRLKHPKTALQHFTTVEKNTEDYRYQARALYWKARALERLSRSKEARKTFELCSAYGSTFWGQLARTALGKPIQFSACKEEHPSKLRENKKVAEMIQAAHLFTLAQEDLLAGSFTFGAGKHTETRDDVAYFLNETVAISPYVGIQAYIAYAGKKLHAPCKSTYPTLPIHDILKAQAAVNDILTLSIIRTESAFSERVVEPNNLGIGYMQLMPETAKEVATRHAFPDSSHELLLKKEYSMLLGTTFLKELLDHFQGCYLLAIAAYNAGPNAVDRWITNAGDPRTGAIDMVDWIELIPYKITRLYVQKVLTDMQIYAHLLHKQGFDLPTLLKRKGH